jgi:hypothetical protein
MPSRGAVSNLNRPGPTGKFKRCLILAFFALLAIGAIDQMRFSPGILAQKARSVTRQTNQDQVAGGDCSYLKAPENFRGAQARHREMVSRTTEAVSANLSIELAPVHASVIPRKNLIDAILFDRMERDNVASAPLCTDEEFIRRVYLDLTGRIPSPADVTKFLGDQTANKRDTIVDQLLNSPEYVDKWTMFFGDLFRNTQNASNISLFFGGREAYYNYIRDAVATNKSYALVAKEMIGDSGDSFVNGQTNFIVLGNVPMGPAQDTMDGLAVRVATTFLGIGAMDCLLCHNGAGHLNAINLWGATTTRAQAWGLSAFFARTARRAQTVATNYQKYLVAENATGEYMLNTSSGNRQPRNPINGKNSITPAYPFGAGVIQAGENRRQALSRLVVEDKQFSRAAVNYLWEKLMVEGLVSPSNTFDLARLDPKAELPAGWALQPANAELLEALAVEFKNSDFNIRAMIGLIAKSSAYQLSSKYPGEWKLEYVPYYARKYARRLDAEELHDAIVKATKQPPVTTYRDPNNQNQTIIGFPIMDQNGQFARSVQWAMQLPDTVEPRSNGASAAFLNSFLRGNRDSTLRSDDASILQALNLMNNGFLMNRIHQGNRVTIANQPEIPSAVRELLANTSLTNDQIITQLYLNTLSRNPTDSEKAKLLPYFASMGKPLATESIQWVLLNKVDFIFNY